MILKETYTLRNGVKVPKIGLGTWQIPDGEDTYNSVTFALNNGYRHIDTAKAYGNEKVLEKQLKIREFQEKRFLLQQSCLQNVKATTLQRNALKNLWLI